MKKLLIAGFTALFALLAAPAVSAQLPNVNVKDTKGKTVNVAKLNNNGKPFVISFFATWCKPCLRELHAIADLYPDWQEETGMKMYIVSIDDAQNTSKVKPFVDAEGWDYEVLLDANSDFFRAMGLQSVPHVLVVDGNGKIAYTHSGYTDGAETELIKVIRKLNSKKK
ncbi:MAG: TlpA family protein disulfide reductase [Muribaculaceae bacterium]|nr:TlpA family protein disulfide reductase [Muribaculaceae bacterium]MDE5595071.1 TlpA family protein disulfide reductase [Muribaculaceae bacterium]MDE6702421.1 TlpA family protein disulfide reductase [Muribaculaceae bacterium]